MNPDTGELRRYDEIAELPEEERKKFVPIPRELSAEALALLAWRDKKRKMLKRRRARLAKASRQRNR